MDRVAVFTSTCMVLAMSLATIATDPGGHPLISLSLDARHWPNVIVYVANGSKDAVRLWEDRNSWGWANFSLCAVTSDGRVRSIVRKPASFDKNGPTFYIVPPGGTKAIRLNLSDGWWQEVDDEMLRQSPLAVSVILHIVSSTEATELHVWTGTAISPWTDQVGQ